MMDNVVTCIRIDSCHICVIQVLLRNNSNKICKCAQQYVFVRYSLLENVCNVLCIHVLVCMQLYLNNDLNVSPLVG